ncbi:MAG TPA: anti-sigma factor [Solirubrobacteraceae bacterium]|jgi:anti-sigma-K factor RskA|nr:anti-sigma factor [Solirubrobacteraceae bacterium]
MNPFEHDKDCPQLLDAAPYVLGALEENELRSYREHLADCALCRLEVAELQSVVDELAGSAPPVHAPAALRERVLASVRSQAEVLSAAGHEADRPQRSARRRQMPRFALAGATAFAAAVAAVVVILLSGGSSTTSERVITGQATGAARGAEVALHQRDGRAELLLSRMPQPGAGRIYEVWVVRSGVPRPTDALFGVSSSGAGAVDIPGSLHGVKQVLVTSEPLGGSQAPTRAPVIAVALSA